MGGDRRNDLLDLVRIERRDDPVPQALSAAERVLARRRLEIELELARIAALRADQQAFTGGLETAVAILRRDFDIAAADVEGATALMEGAGFELSGDGMWERDGEEWVNATARL